jgi:hypothetical protein
MIQWRIFYDDGSTFDNEQGAPYDAPGLGVICIVKMDTQSGRGILSGFDYYLYIDIEWMGADLFGLLDHVLNRFAHLRGVCAGRTIDNGTYQLILRRAHEDDDFPVKSGRRENERPRVNTGIIES